MKIVKLTTDIIELRTDSGIVYESFTSCITTARVICMGATVQIFVEGRYINIEVSELTATQVLPAAEVPFPALSTGSDLLALLNADFFEVCGAGSSVEQYANLAAFPAVGDANVIYIAEDTNFTYRWDGSAYVLVGDGSDLPLIGGYPSGSYHLFANSFGTIQANFVIAPDIIEGFVTEIKYPCQLEAARIRVQAAVAGSAVVGLAKYNITTGLFELVAQTDPATPFNLGIASTQEVAYDSPVAFEPGIYANLIWGDSAATIYNIQRFAASTFFGYSPTIGTTADEMSVSAALAYTGTFPSSMSLANGHRSGSLIPFLLHKVS